MEGEEQPVEGKKLPLLEGVDKWLPGTGEGPPNDGEECRGEEGIGEREWRGGEKKERREEESGIVMRLTTRGGVGWESVIAETMEPATSMLSMTEGMDLVTAETTTGMLSTIEGTEWVTADRIGPATGILPTIDATGAAVEGREEMMGEGMGFVMADTMGPATGISWMTNVTEAAAEGKIEMTGSTTEGMDFVTADTKGLTAEGMDIVTVDTMGPATGIL